MEESKTTQVLNIQSALEMMGDDKDLLKELLTSFVTETIFEEQKLLDLEAQPDTTEAAKYVHLFKGGGRQLGAERLGESGQALEDVLRGRKTGNIPELTKAFVSDYKLTVAAVKDALEIL